MVLALIGNQNCGKTTLFNALTGSNQHVGNFPGVTIEKKEGTIKGKKNITVVDLPGIYSLSPYSKEEVVTRDFLIKEKPDGIINIIDATNIERNLYLTLQLLELNIPTVLALNMMDEVQANGTTINIHMLINDLGIPVIPITASKGEGIEDLTDQIVETIKNKARPKIIDFCSGSVHRAIHSISHIIEDHAIRIHIPRRFAATKLVEGDELMTKELEISVNEKDAIEHIVSEMEKEMDTDRKAALADMRYEYISKICHDSVIKKGISKGHIRSHKIDNILTNKYAAIPLFLGIMFLIFWLTFGIIGKFLSDILNFLITNFTNFIDTILTNASVNNVIHSLIINGIFRGIGSILLFLPIIVVLFFFLSILEDTGYMSRIAFVMDKLLRKLGLSGSSFVPMLIGFGCSVPAVMATRTLTSDRDRKITILLIPFMSCSAKLPIYAVFTASFFIHYQALVMISIYVIGIILGIIVALILKKYYFKGNPTPFLMELPPYRMPSLKTVTLLMWDKAKDFLIRAFTIIFIATIIIWFLQSFDMKFNYITDSSNSILAFIGKIIAPLFYPLGFHDWRISTSLITGFTAKEAVVSTLAVLTNSGTSLISTLHNLFTPLTAFCFLIFSLLYTPCVAAIATIKKELDNIDNTMLIILFQLYLAWTVTFIIYRIGLILGG